MPQHQHQHARHGDAQQIDHGLCRGLRGDIPLTGDVGGDLVARGFQRGSREQQHVRDAHLAKAWAAHDRRELILAGALAYPVDGAALLFAGNSADIAANFARDDPYVVNGLVTRWRVREWTTVVGEGAATPIGAERT